MSLDRNSYERERRPSACKLCLSPTRPAHRGRRKSNTGRRGIDHYTVPVLGLTHLEATAIHIMLASGPLKIFTVYLSPSRPIVGSELSACFGGGFPVLTAGDLNAKHVDWNSRLTTTSGKLLRDYASGHSCLIYGPDSPTTLPYNSTATPDVLDMVITNLLSVSDGVLSTKLRSPSCTDGHDMLIILPQPASPT
jgi:hypothetical protein